MKPEVNTVELVELDLDRVMGGGGLNSLLSWRWPVSREFAIEEWGAAKELLGRFRGLASLKGRWLKPGTVAGAKSHAERWKELVDANFFQRGFLRSPGYPFE